MPSVDVDLSAVIKDFAGAGERLQQATTKALEQAGLGLEAAIKPVTPYRTGRLRASIASALTGPTTLRVGVIKPADGKVLIYAPFVEFGTRYIEPRLYVTGTFEKQKPRVTEFLRKKIIEAMRAE